MPINFTCPYCGRQSSVLEQYAGQSGPCAGCGQIVTVPPLSGGSGFPAGPQYRMEDDAGMRLLLPVGRSLWAIAAGYAGLFALTGVLAPLAILLGAIAIWDIKRHPDRHGMGRAIFGLVMGIVVCTIALVIAVVAALTAR